jgi:SOS-response transcriptional repressor LexA
MAVAKLKKSAMAQWVETAMLHSNNMSQAELARLLAQRLRVDFDRSKVNKIVIDKRQVSAEEMLAIEEITGYPAPAAIRSTPRADKPAKIVTVPLLDLVSAGRLKSPSSQIPLEDVPLLAFADLGRGEWFALKVESDADSMDRVSPEGSIIIVNRADRTLVTGKFYVFAVKGKTTFKMWPGGSNNYLEPYSTNPANKPVFFKKSELEVIGRVKRTVLDL